MRPATSEGAAGANGARRRRADQPPAGRGGPSRPAQPIHPQPTHPQPAHPQPTPLAARRWRCRLAGAAAMLGLHVDDPLLAELAHRFAEAGL